MAERSLQKIPSNAFLPETHPRSSNRPFNYLKHHFDSKELQFRYLTAEQFADVWSHYDRDGNGYIEGEELKLFYSELLDTILPHYSKQHMSTEELDALIQELRTGIDSNGDSRIEIVELAQLLPTDEEFIFLFIREKYVASSVDFMRVWKIFDKDQSGFIEADELKAFLKELLKNTRKGSMITEDKLIEYTDNMLRIFDKNKDGKLQLSEMARVLPVKENFLRKPFFKSPDKISNEDIDRVFSYYDQDKNGYLQDEELLAFFKDLLELTQEDYDAEDLQYIQQEILQHLSNNRHGRIYIDEMKMMIRAQCQIVETSPTLK